MTTGFEANRVWVRAGVQRYGRYAALYLVGLSDGPIDPLDLIVDGVSYSVRVLIPPHHVVEPGDDARAAGFRVAVPIDPNATEVAAHLVSHGRGHRVMHDLGRLPVPPTALGHFSAVSNVGWVRPELVGRRRPVLVAPHVGGTGGAQWWLGEVTAALNRTDWADVDVLRAVRLPGGPPGLAAAKDDNAFEAAVAVRTEEIVRRRPAVVLVNTVEGLETAEACRRLAVPFCWAIHESYAPPVLWASVFEFAEPAPVAVHALDHCLAEAQKVVFVAEGTRALFAPYAASFRSEVLPFRVGAVADMTSQRDRRPWGVSDGAFVVLSVGTLEERKNPGLLVAAMAQARRSVPNLHLLLAGPGPSDYGAWLASLAENQGLIAGFTHILREVAVDELLALADVYVSASDVESRPVVLLEAMTARVPIVATRACGVAELIDDGVDGVLCAPGDCEALAAAVVALARAPGWRSELARRAFEKVAALPVDWVEPVVAVVAAAARV